MWGSWREWKHLKNCCSCDTGKQHFHLLKQKKYSSTKSLTIYEQRLFLSVSPARKEVIAQHLSIGIDDFWISLENFALETLLTVSKSASSYTTLVSCPTLPLIAAYSRWDRERVGSSNWQQVEIGIQSMSAWLWTNYSFSMHHILHTHLRKHQESFCLESTLRSS